MPSLAWKSLPEGWVSPIPKTGTEVIWVLTNQLAYTPVSEYTFENKGDKSDPQWCNSWSYYNPRLC